MFIELTAILRLGAVACGLAQPAAQQPEGETSKVRLENFSAQRVELWIGSEFLGAIPARSHTSIKVPAETWRGDNGSLVVTALSEGEAKLFANSIAVSPGWGPPTVISWGGFSAPELKQAEEVNPAAQSTLAGFFAERRQRGGDHRPGHPVKHSATMFGLEFNNKPVAGELLVVSSDRATVACNRFGMLLRQLPAGSYTIGQAGGAQGRKVVLSRTFLIASTEVTRAQWALGRGEELPAKDQDLPVANVTWDQANTFCQELGAEGGWVYSLPTEAQWEYACQGGVLAPFNPGRKAMKDIMWSGENAGGRTHRVATRVPNSFGLFDMHGNVREWCLDWWSPVPSVGTDPTGPKSGSQRVRRGGSIDWPAAWCSCGNRDAAPPSLVDPAIGFRVVLVQHKPAE